MTEPQVTKRRVTLADPIPTKGEDGQWVIPGGHGAVDYVRPDFLEAYVADAKTRWGSVVVSEEPDAGPGGYHGQTHVPAHLDHELAGQTFPATTPED